MPAKIDCTLVNIDQYRRRIQLADRANRLLEYLRNSRNSIVLIVGKCEGSVDDADSYMKRLLPFWLVAGPEVGI